MNEDSVVQGNTVLQPTYDPSKHNQGEENKKRKQQKKIRKSNAKNKLKVIRNTALAFIVGLVLVTRFCIIYDMQRQLNGIKANINELNKENENLKVELVNSNNLQYIEETAINKLHMLPPDKNSAVYSNLSKSVVKSLEEKKKEKIEKNIWYKLRNILF